MTLMKLELDQQETNDLVQLLDIAVKAGGLQWAPKAVNLFAKVQAAVAEQKPQTQEDEK